MRIRNLLLVALVALGSAAALLWATDNLELKWLIAIVIGLFFPWIAITARDPEYLLLVLFVFFLPVNPDVHLGQAATQNVAVAGARGLALSALDVFLIALYVSWGMKLLLLPSEERKIQFVPSITLPFGLYLIFGSLSSLKAVDPQWSFYELVRLVKLWFVFFYFANNLREERQLIGVGLALCGAVLVQGSLAIAQYFLGTTFGLQVLGESHSSYLVQEMGVSELSRVGGTLGHPNGLALFLVMLLPIVVALALSGRSRWLAFFASLALIVGFVALVLTFSRAGWICVATTIPLVAFLAAWRRWGFLRATGALLCFCFVVTLILLPFTGLISQRLFEEDYGRAWSRVPLMQVAWNVIRSNPLLGVGLNNYIMAMDKYDNTLEHITLDVKNPVHNMFLLIAGEMGIPALLIFLWLIVVLLRHGWDGFQRRRGLLALFCLGLFGALLSFLIHAQVNISYIGRNYTLALFMGLLAASSFWKGSSVRPEERIDEKPEDVEPIPVEEGASLVAKGGGLT